MTCPSARLAHRLHLAQLVVQGLADEGLEPFECAICLRLHVGAKNGRREHICEAVSFGTAQALKVLKAEILSVLEGQRRERRPC